MNARRKGGTLTTSETDGGRVGRSWVVPASAIAFAVLFVAGVFTGGAASDTSNKTAAEVLKTFNDEKNGVVVGAFLLVLAGLCFVPVAWAVIRRVNAGLSELGEHVARASAQLFITMVLVAAAAFSTLAATVVFANENDPPDDLVRFVPQLGNPILLIAGALSAAVFLAVISRAGQTSATVPSWFSVLGYIAAVAMLGGVVFVPMILLPIWALAAAYVLR